MRKQPRIRDSLLCKLGSAIIHAEEFMSEHGDPNDKDAFDALMQDTEVVTFMEDLQKLAMLPVKRNV